MNLEKVHSSAVAASTTQAGPTTQARGVTITLKRLDTLPPAQKSAILARLPPGFVERFKTVRDEDWVEMSAVVDLTSAIYSVLGPEGFTRMWSQMLDSYFKTAFVKGVLSFVLRTFTTTRKMMERLPAIWRSISRGVEPVLVWHPTNPNEARWILEGIPEKLAADVSYQEATRMAIVQYIQLSGAKSIQVESVHGVASKRRMEYRCAWK